MWFVRFEICAKINAKSVTCFEFKSWIDSIRNQDKKGKQIHNRKIIMLNWLEFNNEKDHPQS